MTLRRVLLAAWVVGVGAAEVATPTPAAELLRNRIEAAGSPAQIVVGDELVQCSFILPRFYEERLFGLARSDARGPGSQATRLVEALKGGG